MKKTYVLSKIYLLLFAVCFVQLLSAQTVKITGRITNKVDTKPLVGVTISVPDDGAGGYSDEAGNYVVEIEKKGRSSVKIQAEMLDYVTSEIEVPLGNSDNVKLDITLLPTTFTEKDVVISATKGSADQLQKDVTVSIAVVKQRSIDLQATTNVDKVITQVPGVDNLDGQINIRGSSGYAYGAGSRVMVLLDGLPLLNGEAGSAELSMIPVDNIAQVEVMKGASSVMYGSGALGGVINVITGDASDKPRTSIRLRGGFYGAPRNPILDWDGKSSATNASAHLFHQRKIGDFSFTAQSDFINETGYRQGADSKEIRAILHTRYQPKKVPGLIIGLNATYRHNEYGTSIFYDKYYPTRDTILKQGDSMYVSNHHSTVTNLSDGTLGVVSGNVLGTGVFNPSSIDTAYHIYGGGLTPSATAGVFRRQTSKRIAIDPTIKYLTENGKHLFWYRGRFLKNDNITNSGQSAVSFVSYNDFLYQTSIFKDKVKWVTGATIMSGSTKSPELYNGNYTQTSTGFYSQLDGKFGRLNASLGGRIESTKTNILAVTSVPANLVEASIRNGKIIEKRNSRPIFRAGLNYEVARATNIRASFGQAFRVPTIAEYFAQVGAGGVIVTPNLFKADSSKVVKPEFGYSTEIGIRQGFAFGEKTRGQWRGYLDLAGFMMRYNNMMEFGLDNFSFSPTFDPLVYFSTRNVADARITGFELTTMNTYSSKDFQYNLSGGITYIVPINLVSAADSDQIDLSFFNAANYGPKDAIDLYNEIEIKKKIDAPRELKYRNRTLVRLSTGFNYKKYGFATNYRYRSFQTAIDQYLYLVVGDAKDFRTRHPNGEHVFDLIFSYDITDNNRISLNVDNAFNAEYFVIPGTIAEQRKFTLQYQIRF